MMKGCCVKVEYHKDGMDLGQIEVFENLVNTNVLLVITFLGKGLDAVSVEKYFFSYLSETCSS